MGLKIIAAVDENWVIGDSKTNKMPWYIPEELLFFRNQTFGHTVVMGRKTAESVGHLGGRTNIVLSRDRNLRMHGFVASDFDEITYASKSMDIYICGGAEIYRLFMPVCDEVILSKIKMKSDGDIKFPMNEFMNRDVCSLRILKMSDLFVSEKYKLSPNRKSF